LVEGCTDRGMHGDTVSSSVRLVGGGEGLEGTNRDMFWDTAPVDTSYK